MKTKSALEDVLPLAPLQERFLFHALYDREAPDIYHVQLVLRIEGAVDAGLLRRSAGALLARHANLRAGFPHPQERRGDPGGAPRGGAALAGAGPDRRRGRGGAGGRAGAAVRGRPGRALRPRPAAAAADDAGPARRGAVRPDPDLPPHPGRRLVDPLLLDELFTLYARDASPAGLPPSPPYRDYLAWLARQDVPAAERAWRRALDGVGGADPGGRAGRPGPGAAATRTARAAGGPDGAAHGGGAGPAADHEHPGPGRVGGRAVPI
ncbi:hypothetical protein LT493_25730 [Streptomyces tricolor]|nr:hypothetical protein [Streptomyces tricolor]